MKITFKIILFFIYMPTVLFANGTNHFDKKHEKSKTISKDFNVLSNAVVLVDNKYGNLNVSTWNKNTVEIKVIITVKGDDISSVNDKLEGITIAFKGTDYSVEARTTIQKNKSRWSFWNTKNIEYKVNYFIKMPKTNNIDFNNKYGNIAIDETRGKTNINCSYGNIYIDQLWNETNVINLDYCGASEINYIKAGNISLDYTKLDIDTTEDLKLSSDYSNLKILDAKTLNFNCDYGTITAKKIETISGSSDYTTIKIGKLKTKLKVSTDYGAIQIENIEDTFEDILINSDYTSVKMGTKSTNSFQFNINVSYANFSYPENNTEIFKRIKKSNNKYFEGVFGTGNPNGTIRINSSYGNVKLKLNY